MKKIKLTQGKYALVDDEDFEAINKFKWCADRHGNGWRVIRKTKNAVGKWITQYMHRFIVGVPNGLEIDHQNHDGLDNRKFNLRICTHAENAMNQQPHKKASSQFKGVYWEKKSRKWRAQIYSNNKEINLGAHVDEIAAAKVYDTMTKKLFGKYAYLNFKEEK